MNIIWNFDHCVSVFNQEIALLQKICQIQDSVREAVMAREWADFDWKMAEISQLGEDFNNLEAERVDIFAALKEKFIDHQQNNEDSASFYALIANLPHEQCRQLSGLFRELKMETLKLKTQNEIFVAYLNEIKLVTSAWMEAIFPVQGGKLYTRKGSEASGELRSVVLSRHI